MQITVPELSLILLVGPSGSGKSTFARAHFRETEVVSSDRCRALVADDEADQTATKDAFVLLQAIVRARLRRGRLTVVDATNVRPEARKALLECARQQYVSAVAITFDLPAALCVERNLARSERVVEQYVVEQHAEWLRHSLGGLQREGFERVYTLRSPAEVDAATIVRERFAGDRREDAGPFDLVGDVHGCADELEALLAQIGYAVGEDRVARHPAGRRLIFVGDLVDRGPRVPDALRLAIATVDAGLAYCVPGNHDDKLRRALRGRPVRIAHGLEISLEQLKSEPAELRERAASFVEGLPSHYVFDGGRLVVAHAGIKEGMIGRTAHRVRDFTLYGETRGEVDEFGLPIRYNWAANYRGEAMIVYGHTPVRALDWLNRTLNIDTGCVFGGQLTALRYPELELVSVPAARAYAASSRGLIASMSALPTLPNRATGEMPAVRDAAAAPVTRPPE